MIFTRLVITNFGVYRGRHEFELRPQVEQGLVRPVILFGGKNGSGKTTILEAIRLCLYGRSALGSRIRRADYDAFIRQRIHRSFQEDTIQQSAQVGLIIEHTHAGVQSTYDAVRSWQIEGQTLRENVSIFKDGVALQDIAPEHWNDFLRDLIPPGVADLFFFDGEQIQALADTNREAEVLSNAVKGLLNLDLVNRLRADLGVYLRQQSKQDRSQLQANAVELDEAFSVCEQRYIELKQDHAQNISRLNYVVAKHEKARQALLVQGGSFASNRQSIVDRQADIEYRVKAIQGEIRELVSGLLPFAITPVWGKRLQQRLDHEKRAQHEEIVRQAQVLQASEIALKFLDPQFQQQTALEILPQAWARISSAVQALLQPTGKSEGLDIRHPISEQERITLQHWLQSALSDIPSQLHILTIEMEKLEAERSQLEQALRQIPDDTVTIPLLDEFNTLAEAKGRIELELEQIDLLLAQQRREKDELDRRRNQALERLAASDSDDIQVARAAKVQVILNHYLEQITTIKVQELEQAIGQFFNSLCRKQKLVREVRIDLQTFEVTLYTENRSILYKSDLSAGEKQLYAMALLWALRSVSGRALPIIVDTPMGRLDSDHRATVLTEFFPNAAHQIVLLSTDTEVDAAAFKLLQPVVSHTFRLEFDQTQGFTQVQRGYFVDETEEALI